MLCFRHIFQVLRTFACWFPLLPIVIKCIGSPTVTAQTFHCIVTPISLTLVDRGALRGTRSISVSKRRTGLDFPVDGALENGSAAGLSEHYL